MSNFSYFLYFTMLLGLTPSWLSAQKIEIKGHVRDLKSGARLASAHVYLAQTTFGSSTDAKGQFRFQIKPGLYDLVVSHVEYQDTIQTLLLVKDTILNLSLRPTVKNLPQILVQADTSQWKANFKTFQKYFLGSSQNAQMTRIENPRALYLFYDPEENMFYAHAKEEIIIQNEALGYRVFFNLKDFLIDFNSGFLKSYGIPRFEALSPKSKRQAKQWSKNRRRAYQGSFPHLIDAIRSDKIKESKFVIQEIQKKQVVEDTHFIRRKVSYFREKVIASAQKNLSLELRKSPYLDSLKYWQQLEKNGGYQDSTGSAIQQTSALMLDPNTMCCKKLLKVTYQGEAEEAQYAMEKRMSHAIDTKQTSFIYFPQNSLDIAHNGYYPVEQVIFEGYMGWASKIADMLPLNYQME